MSAVYHGTTNRNGPAISDQERMRRVFLNAAADAKFKALIGDRWFNIRCTNDAGGQKPSRPETHAGDRASSMNYGI